LWQFDHFDIFSPKCPHHIFYFSKKKNPRKKKQKKKKKKKKYAGVAEPTPGHPSIFLLFFGFFFFLKIKYVMGVFWGKKGQSGQIATI
jgi:hypothetical protein